MRTFLVAALLLAALLSTAPAEARPYPVECVGGIYAWSCTTDAVACDASAGAAYDGSFHSVGASCVGGVSCDGGLSGTEPVGPACSVPASGPGYGCEPTTHGMRCEGDFLVCTTYSGAESSGLSYSGFDCGAAACDLLFYQGRLKDHDCSVATAAAAPPLPTDCVTPAITYTCTVDAGVCFYKQTSYFDGRQTHELRCLDLVDCTWSSDGSAARAEVEPFCPLPF